MCSGWWIDLNGDDVAGAPADVFASAGKQARRDPGVNAAAGDVSTAFFEGGEFGWMRVTL